MKKSSVFYTYEDMEKDICRLQTRYECFMKAISLGDTADDRNIRCVVVGDENASDKMLIHAGIHGREYMTCCLVMKQLEKFLEHLGDRDRYRGYSYADMMRDAAIYVLPMVNPDGVTISQYGMEKIRDEGLKKSMRLIRRLDGGKYRDAYFRYWKANATGVDLNRNFDAMWEEYQGNAHPSYHRYKGRAAGCEAESAAMIRLTKENRFRRTISYHAQGSVIYWYFAQKGRLYDESYRFAERIARVTGYSMDCNQEQLDPAGYKDWAISKCGIPSITIEIGRETSPVPEEQFSEIWLQNQYVWEETLIDMKI